MRLRVGMVSLGCAKNLVDSEEMMGLLETAGYELVSDPKMAEIILVNTCGFIDSAKEESIEAILEMARYKETGHCRALVVTGCLTQRYAHELTTEIPEIDGVLGTGELDELVPLVEKVLEGERKVQVAEALYPVDLDRPRRQSTPKHWAYLKIGEGCDNRCSYCVIPDLRGPYRSRPMERLVAGARDLVAKGVRELNLVAQDTTAYGVDRYSRPALLDLLTQLEEIPGLEWIRLLYTYPTRFGPDLIEKMAGSSKIVPYLDMPLQHVDGTILKHMGRPGGPDEVRRLLGDLRAAIPDLAIRSTFIVGFPGETEEQYLALEQFIREVPIDHLGVFTYSREEGTPAAAMPGQVPQRIKQARRASLMDLQAKLVQERNLKYIGRILPVLVDGVSPESDWVLEGRIPQQAPEVDGKVILGQPEESVQVGDLVKVQIIEAHGYDLVAEVCEGRESP